MGDSAIENLNGKLGLDTTDFKTGVAAANRELRVLESGFRAGVAALGDWANSATGLEARVKSLTSQSEVQRLKVAALREEYERIAAEKGKNSTAAQNLEIKLNKETETLGKMENELGDTQTALQEMGSAAQESGEQVEQSGQQAQEAGPKFNAFGKAAEAAGAIIKGVTVVIGAIVGVITAVVTALGGLVFKSAETADELGNLSTKTGMSAESLQELEYAGKQLGFSLDTVTTSNARLVRSMDDAAKNAKGEMAGAFEELGVSVTDANGNLRSSEEVFYDVIDALGAVENPAERDALAMQLLGKNAQELNPLIKAGADELARLSDEAHRNGAIVSTETLTALGGLSDQLDGIKATVGATALKLAGTLAPSFSKVLTAIQDVITKGAPILAYVFENVIAPVVDWLADKFVALTERIDWSAIIEGVVNLGKTMEFILSGKFDLAKWLTDIDWGALSQTVAAGMASIDWNAVGLAIGTFLKTAFTVAFNAVTQTDWAALGSGVLDALVGIAEGILQAFGVNADWEKMWADLGAQLETFTGLLAEKAPILMENLGEAVKSAVGKLKPALMGVGKYIVEGVWTGIQAAKAYFYALIKEFFQGMVDSVLRALGIQSPSKVFAAIGRNTVLGFAQGFSREFASAEQMVAAAFGGLAVSPVFTGGAGGPALSAAGGNVTNVYFYGTSFGQGSREMTLGDILDRFGVGQ